MANRKNKLANHYRACTFTVYKNLDPAHDIIFAEIWLFFAVGRSKQLTNQTCNLKIHPYDTIRSCTPWDMTTHDPLVILSVKTWNLWELYYVGLEDDCLPYTCLLTRGRPTVSRRGLKPCVDHPADMPCPKRTELTRESG